MRTVPFADPAVKAIFEAYSPPLRKALLRLRSVIFSTAADCKGVGELTECLKWRQPAYLTNQSKSGSTIRIDAVRGQENVYAAYFHCQTDLVARFREVYPRTFIFEGNRAMHFSVGEPLPEEQLRHCLAMTLTYHLDA